MELTRDEDGKLHAFVFIDHTERKISSVIDDLFDLRDPDNERSARVRWAGAFVGDYIGFAHVEADDQNALSDLQGFLEGDVWDAGVHCKWATEVAVNVKGTKRSTPAVIAIVAIKTEHGRAVDVLEQLNPDRIDGFAGVSLVTGEVDILLQLNADSLVGVQDLLLQPALDIEGIVSTSTSICDGTRSRFHEGS